MPHIKIVTSDYRDFKNNNIIGVVTNTQCSDNGVGWGISDDHGGRGVVVIRGGSIKFDPPPLHFEYL